MYKLVWLLAVAFHLSKLTGRDELLEDLHQILYARKGKVCFAAAAISTFREHACCSPISQQNLCCDNSVLLDLQLSTRKKDIQAFSGFTFTDDQQASLAFSAST